MSITASQYVIFEKSILVQLTPYRKESEQRRRYVLYLQSRKMRSCTSASTTLYRPWCIIFVLTRRRDFVPYDRSNKLLLNKLISSCDTSISSRNLCNPLMGTNLFGYSSVSSDSISISGYTIAIVCPAYRERSVKTFLSLVVKNLSKTDLSVLILSHVISFFTYYWTAWCIIVLYTPTRKYQIRAIMWCP